MSFDVGSFGDNLPLGQTCFWFRVAAPTHSYMWCHPQVLTWLCFLELYSQYVPCNSKIEMLLKFWFTCRLAALSWCWGPQQMPCMTRPTYLIVLVAIVITSSGVVTLHSHNKCSHMHYETHKECWHMIIVHQHANQKQLKLFVMCWAPSDTNWTHSWCHTVHPHALWDSLLCRMHSQLMATIWQLYCVLSLSLICKQVLMPCNIGMHWVSCCRGGHTAVAVSEWLWKQPCKNMLVKTHSPCFHSGIFSKSMALHACKLHWADRLLQHVWHTLSSRSVPDEMGSGKLWPPDALPWVNREPKTLFNAYRSQYRIVEQGDKCIG